MKKLLELRVRPTDDGKYITTITYREHTKDGVYEYDTVNIADDYEDLSEAIHEVIRFGGDWV